MKFNLSEVNELIQNRRSIAPEHYSSRKVHREIIEQILTNATWAPNHGMTQPWRFKVFTGQGLQRLSDELPTLYKATIGKDFSDKKFEKLRARLANVSVVICVCMERQETRRIPEIEEIEAVACAVQNMYLSATAYGIGAYWSSPAFCYTNEMKDYLDLGKEDKCLGLFYLGYPEVEWPSSHRKPLEYVTQWFDK